jgi:anti-sigma regulatory factor (Ser/Thr protein kinase)
VICDAREDSKAVLDGLEARCRAAGFAEHTVIDLRLVAEEVLTNIGKYGYEPKTKPAAELVVSLTETKPSSSFATRAALIPSPPSPDSTHPSSGRAGASLPLLRALVDEARYVRRA